MKRKYTAGKSGLFLCLLITGFLTNALAQTPKLTTISRLTGTWAGTVQRQHQDTGVIYSSPVILRIHYIDTVRNVICFTQIEYYTDPQQRKVLSRNEFSGEVSGENQFGLHVSEENNKCYQTIYLNYQSLNGKEYLNSGKEGYPDASCFRIITHFKKVDNDTSALTINRLTGTTAASASMVSSAPPLQVGQYIYRDTIKAIGEAMEYTLLIKDIREETAGFRYKAIQPLCNIEFTGILKRQRDGSYKYVSDDRKNSFQVTCTGREVQIRQLTCNKGECAYCPADGVYPFRTADISTYNPGKGVQTVNVHTTGVAKGMLPAPSGGGSTPDELGRILLKALKTNNLKLWMSCTHPEGESKAFNERRFREFRQWLEEDGVSDWNLVVFNRVTFERNTSLASDNGEVDGEQVRRRFAIEFTYKNGEFLGGLGHMTISTYKKGKKFLIWFPGKDTEMARKRRS